MLGTVEVGFDVAVDSADAFVTGCDEVDRSVPRVVSLAVVVSGCWPVVVAQVVGCIDE